MAERSIDANMMKDTEASDLAFQRALAAVEAAELRANSGEQTGESEEAAEGESEVSDSDFEIIVDNTQPSRRSLRNAPLPAPQPGTPESKPSGSKGPVAKRNRTPSDEHPDEPTPKAAKLGSNEKQPDSQEPNSEDEGEHQVRVTPADDDEDLSDEDEEYGGMESELSEEL